jgi:hypothetical protein
MKYIFKIGMYYNRRAISSNVLNYRSHIVRHGLYQTVLAQNNSQTNILKLTSLSTAQTTTRQRPICISLQRQRRLTISQSINITWKNRLVLQQRTAEWQRGWWSDWHSAGSVVDCGTDRWGETICLSEGLRKTGFGTKKFGYQEIWVTDDLGTGESEKHRN